MNESIYNGLRYSTREINRDWKIKVYGIVDGKKINVAVGVAGLVKLVGVDMTNKLFDRAVKSMDDKQVCKLRRGIKITFYLH